MQADEVLGRHGVTYRLIEQDEPTHTCHDSAEVRGVSQRQIVKSLLVERDGEPVHVLVPGNRELRDDLDWPLLPDDRVEEVSGFPPGTVHPFSTELPHVVDERLLEREELSFTTGDPEQGIVIGTERFRRALEDHCEVEVDDVSQGEFPAVERLMDDEGLERADGMFLVRHDELDRFEALRDLAPADTVTDTIRFVHRAIEQDGRDLDRLDALGADDWEQVMDADRSRRRSMLVAVLEGDEIAEDDADVGAVVQQVIDEEDEAIEDLRAGKDSAMNYLVGQVMQRTQGQADPQDVRERFRDAIDME